MKIFVIVLRTLLGLLFLFASITYFLKLITPPPVSGAMKTFNEGAEASIYLIPLAKALELLCGVSFVSGYFVPLMAIVILPVSINIFCINLFLMPDGLFMALPVLIINLVIIYYHREIYKPMLKQK